MALDKFSLHRGLFFPTSKILEKNTLAASYKHNVKKTIPRMKVHAAYLATYANCKFTAFLKNPTQDSVLSPSWQSFSPLANLKIEQMQLTQNLQKKFFFQNSNLPYKLEKL